ncbi:MAG: amidohydrolase family protein [Phycisphaerae bacterium]
MQSWFIRRQVDPPWMLRGVDVIDIHTGVVRENVYIVIAGDRIQSIGTDKPSKRMKVVDASGLYVIPGLFDLHAHVMPKSRLFPAAPAPDEALRLLLNAGVTTIRALPFNSESALLWAAQVNSGTLAGPTMIVASSILEKERQRTMLGFGDPSTAAAWVRKEALLGVRWIKAYNRMDEDSLRMIVDTARKFGMKVCGHANEVPPHRAAVLGMDSVEHATSIAYSCLRDDAGNAPGQVGLVQAAWYWKNVDTAKLDRLMKTFLENETAWVPTLVVLEKITASGGHDMISLDQNVIDEFRKAMVESAKLAVRFHRDGGLLGIGTDFPVDGVPPGESVHRELELIVEFGGATPLEALQMGTINSARILGFEELLGVVDVGRLAHLVVLTENPIDDISHVRSIRYVIHDGRLYEP